MLLSHSEITDYIKCEQLWFNKYIRRLVKKGELKGPLAYGVYGHDWLYRYYSALATGASREDSIAAANELINELLVSFTIDVDFALWLMTILSEYVKRYPDPELEIIGVEKKYKARINDDVELAGTIDIVVKGTKDNILAVDHKFTNNFWRTERVMLNAQVPKYIWLLRQNEIDAEGGVFNQLRYRKMDIVKNEAFRRTPVAPTDTRINNIVSQFALTASKIATIKSDTNVLNYEPVKSLNSMCDYCVFDTMCDAQLDGRDTSKIEQVHFRTDDPYLNSYKELEVNVGTN